MARSKDLRERTRYTGATLATQVVTALAALLFLAPLLIILNYSFKTKRELYIGNPLALPESLNLTNYQNAYNKLDLSVTFVNTALYTIVAKSSLCPCSFCRQIAKLRCIPMLVKPITNTVKASSQNEPVLKNFLPLMPVTTGQAPPMAFSLPSGHRPFSSGRARTTNRDM